MEGTILILLKLEALLINLSLLSTSIFTYFAKFNTKNIITSIIVYFLIIFNINDLIITIVIISNKLVYYWFADIYFFTYNINNVRKVIKTYEQDIKKNILDTANREYDVVGRA